MHPSSLQCPYCWHVVMKNQIHEKEGSRENQFLPTLEYNAENGIAKAVGRYLKETLIKDAIKEVCGEDTDLHQVIAECGIDVV